MSSTFAPAATSKEVDLDQILKLSIHGETVSLAPGEFLFQEGDDADALYVVRSGTLRVISSGTVYEIVRTGGIVGEMAMVEPGAPRSASVIAGPHSQLAKIGPREFLALIADEPEFALIVMRVMARRLRVMNQRYRPQASAW